MAIAVLDADDSPARFDDDELGRLVARNDQLEAENVALRSEREWLRARVAELEVRVEELRRRAKRQAAPFSRDERRPERRRGGRRPGGAYGKRAHRAAPGEVDEMLEAPAPERCDCGGEIELDRIAHQYQTELPEVQPIRRRFDVGIGHCRRCGRRHQGRHTLQSSDALGAASSMLGPSAVALATQLNKELGLSPAKTAAMLGQFGIDVTPGGIVQAITRQARSLEPTYAALIEGVRASGVVAPDETGWRVDARKAWLWAFVGDGVTVYLIAAGRGYAQAASVLGSDFAGVLERDGWAPYRRFVHAAHQSCLAHLLRRSTEMIADSRAGQARIPHALRRLLLDALALRDRYRAALAGRREVIEGTAVELAAAGAAEQAAGGPTQLPALHAAPKEQTEATPESASAATAAVDGASEEPAQSEPSPLASHPALAQEVAALEQRLERLLRHLAAEREALFTFLCEPGIEATNWRAEQALRPAVVNRKSWGGNRSWAGARTQELAMSVIRTARQQGVDAIELMAAAQRERAPQVTALLRIPARASPSELAA